MPCCLDRDGFTLVRAALAPADCVDLSAAMGPVDSAGQRNVLALPLVGEIARSPRIVELVRPHVGGQPFPVRAIYFNKSADVNWFVGWHQDLTIAVHERVETPGFGPWSVKQGVPHVQPPVDLLERMLTVRIHVDAADGTNGALRVIPGSHLSSRLPSEQINDLRSTRSEVVCCAEVGDALLMRPLLLHASQRAASDRSRRILHVEYAAESLPGGLHWRYA